MKITLVVLIVLTCLTPILAQTTQPGARDAAYLGVMLRQHQPSDSACVSFILPGPLEGKGFSSPALKRGDVILSVNGKKMSAKEIEQFVRDSKAGDEVVLKVFLGDKEPSLSVPAPPETGQEKELRIKLAAWSEWGGPLNLAKAHDSPEQASGEATKFESFVQSQMTAMQIDSPVKKLMEFLNRPRPERGAYHMLSSVSVGFAHPLRLPQIQKSIGDGVASAASDPRKILLEAARNLDLKAPALSDAIDLSQPEPALRALAERVAPASGHLDKAFAQVTDRSREQLLADSELIFNNFARTHSMSEHPEPQRWLGFMQSSTLIDFDELMSAGGALAGVLISTTAPGGDLPSVPLPDALKDAVTGEIVAVLQVDGRTFVYGGAGANTYDLSKLDGVIDAGGDDEYRLSGLPPRVQVVVDFAGNDKYTSDAVGPAGGFAGVNIVVDHAGDDRYEGTLRACGSGVMGIGILLDRNGSDTYAATAWSQGAGFYGVGAIIDAGGSDVYEAHAMSQAIGGPRGFGVILEHGGYDLYRANGPIPSAYGTPAVFSSFSQGFGIGVRQYDAGGIGVLCDLGGNDRYEAGEFAQGGGYAWGMGILNDRGGDDFYYGNRYAQGFGCHQAIGVLSDDGGNDTYWAMTAASQGAAWDEAVGLLLDRAGNDSYRADGLSQGGAAMQGIAMLIDLGGVDHYNAPASATHGQSSGNSYRFEESGCWSFSLFLDAGGQEDFYSTGRTNNSVSAPATPNDAKPQDAGLHGLFVDLPETFDPG